MGVARLILEGYFGLPCPDAAWPSLKHVEVEHGAKNLVIWLQTSMLPGDDGFLDAQEVCSLHEDDVNAAEMCRLRMCISLTNLAWQQVHQYTDLRSRCEACLAGIQRQAEDMLSKLGRQMQIGEITLSSLDRKMKVTQQWREQKERDVRDQLAGKASSVREAIHCALMPIFSTWKMIDANVQQQQLLDAQQYVPMDEDAADDFGSLLNELDGGLETLTLEDSLSYTCCWLWPDVCILLLLNCYAFNLNVNSPERP